MTLCKDRQYFTTHTRQCLPASTWVQRKAKQKRDSVPTITGCTWLMKHVALENRRATLPTPRSELEFFSLFSQLRPDGGGFLFSWCQKTWPVNANLVSDCKLSGRLLDGRLSSARRKVPWKPPVSLWAIRSKLAIHNWCHRLFSPWPAVCCYA